MDVYVGEGGAEVPAKTAASKAAIGAQHVEFVKFSSGPQTSGLWLREEPKNSGP
jgi:hypothetical protein